jgi:hypothetical protein
VKTLEKRTELNPLEEMIIAHTLESAAGQDELMVKINQLTQERTQLQAVLAQHPWSNQGTAKRIREITGELDTLWSELRRARAARRVRLERRWACILKRSQRAHRGERKRRQLSCQDEFQAWQEQGVHQPGRK